MEIYIPFRLAEICLLMESKKYEFLKTVFLMACLLYIFSAIKALQSYRLVVGTIWGMIFDKYCRFFTEFNGFRFTVKLGARYSPTILLLANRLNSVIMKS